MGWLTDLTNWMKEQLAALWDAFEDFMGDLIVDWADQTFAMWIIILSHTPMPDFLDQYSLCTLLNAAGPTVGYFLNVFRVGEGLGLIGAGYVFRLLRKILTLFQW
jgi:hypothetical protein